MSAPEIHLTSKLIQILEAIDSYPSFYRACYAELNQCQNLLTATIYRYALETLLGLAWLEKNREALSKIPDENQRNLQITREVTLVAETGLLPGRTAEEVKEAISLRVNEFKQAYFHDQTKDNLPAFFANGFLGPPCFNGRLITLKGYIERFQLGSSTYEYQQKGDCDAEACELEEIMYRIMEAKQQNSLPTHEDLKDELLSKHPQFAVIYKRACELVTLNNS